MTKDVIPEDTMTPNERFAAMAAGEPFDRIPCIPSLGEHAALVTGIKVSEYHLSSRQMARAQIEAYRLYRHDGVGVGPGHQGVAEAAGSSLAFPDYGTPYVADYAIGEKGDLARLSIPDPWKDGRLPVFLEALEILLQEVGEENPVSLVLGGPLSTASSLRGTEPLMRDLYYDPEFAHQLLSFSVEATVPFVKEVAKLGAGIGIVDPVSSGSLLSAAQFREFAFPYTKRLIDEIKKVGRPPALHICGNTSKIWNEMVETGAGSLSLDNVIDLEAAKRAVGDRIAISGNIRPSETMLFGTPALVEENVRECLRKAYDSPKGYILALGCALPIHTPPENIHALVAAAKRFGRYPYDPELFS
jgi:uroporphyrinogen decarboxylase